MSAAEAAALRDADRVKESAPGSVESLVRLSPSRASDYKICPQLFKYRVVDRLPEPADLYSTRGTLIHAVLEQLYLLDPAERTIERARALAAEVWANLKADPEYASLELDPEVEASWLDQVDVLLVNYFRVEDPTRVSPHELEWWVEHQTGLALLRGIIDRVEIMPDGEWILSDYKTGPIPGQTHEYGAFFGLRFYALVCWRALGVMPKEIRLIYLSDPAMLIFNPTEKMLVAFEQQMHALATAIRRAMAKEDWRTRPSPYCMACSFQSICPAWEQATAERPQRDDLV